MPITSNELHKLMKRLGFIQRLEHEIEELIRKLSWLRVKIEERNDYNGWLSDWSLSGIQYDTNTDSYGRIYVSVSYDGTSTTVSLYKDSARSVKVAEGSISGTSGTVSLSEVSSSGLSGSVYVDHGLASGESYESVYLVARPDFPLILNWLGIEEEEEWTQEFREFATSLLADLTSAATSMLSSVRSAQREFMTRVWAALAKSTETTVSSQTVDTDDEGHTTVEYEGMAGLLRDRMEDLSESVKGTTIGYSVSSDPDNSGVGKLTVQLAAHCRLVSIELVCTSDTKLSESFSVLGRAEDGTVLSAEMDLTVAHDFKSPYLGIRNMILYRGAASVVGDESDHFSDWYFRGTSSTNTDDGVLYFKYTASTRKLEGFKDSGLADSDKVCEGTWDGGDGSTVTLSEYNNSGLSGTVKVSQVAGADPADTTNLQVTLSDFAEDDRFFVSLDYEDASHFNRYWGWQMSTPLPTSDSPTIDEAWARRPPPPEELD